MLISDHAGYIKDEMAVRMAECICGCAKAKPAPETAAIRRFVVMLRGVMPRAVVRDLRQGVGFTNRPFPAIAVP
ncbi:MULTISPECIES: hypothetical protein [Rhodopseudomonas]|uniref:Uncharacterized protein n=1 Tax=Rhodopseudomonas palustris TaxID=1076 RepID=A0A0D7F326_RHOPL|nr:MULTISPECIES: hypothetical protein [Rhodopseudomonas]KIZ47498.1 hypothetical protein OO17_04030 [Rhodopseudomonas palustris]MDF3811450.1 hypothetical protein [Rhodopseudomonas sp. BAL398]WOK16256.1 hypothetical protein RBJ75_19100 [Rhodopseudomonas sp. BAL398]